MSPLPIGVIVMDYVSKFLFILLSDNSDLKSCWECGSYLKFFSTF